MKLSPAHAQQVRAMAEAEGEGGFGCVPAHNSSGRCKSSHAMPW